MHKATVVPRGHALGMVTQVGATEAGAGVGRELVWGASACLKGADGGRAGGPGSGRHGKGELANVAAGSRRGWALLGWRG